MLYDCCKFQHRGQPGRIAAERIDAPGVHLLDRLLVPHRRSGRPQQKAHVAPVDRQVLEPQNGAVGQKRVQVVRVELDRRERDAHLHAALQLKQLDLEVHCRREVRLRLLETTQFDDLARLGPSGRWNGWDGWFLCHLS